MNSNWRKPEEARELCCAILKPKIKDQQFHAVLCDAELCAHWFWRPCDACDTGTVINRDSNNLVHTKCQVCNGTGTDGSGLGRCGLIRG